MRTQARTLGVAVIGLGVGEAHARAYGRDSRCRLLWLVDRDQAKADALGDLLGVSRSASSFEQALRDPEVDIVSVASYDQDHFSQAAAALAAGKHVFVEKPLCRTFEELRALKNARADSSTLLASNLVLRSAPLWRWLKGAIDGGELGRIYAFDGDYLYGRLEKITKGWRKDVISYSVMQGGGVHLVDLMLWLTGQYPESVTSVGSRLCTHGTDFRYDDFVSATYRFPSGLIGRITANFGCIHPHQHVVRIFGTHATFIYDDAGARLFCSRNPEKDPRALDLEATPESKGLLIPDFVSAVLGEDLWQARADHDFGVMAACIAADRALTQNRPVSVERA